MALSRSSSIGFVSLFALGSLAAACGADGAATPDPTSAEATDPSSPDLECPANQVCPPQGMPFVQVALADTDAANPDLPQPGETSAIISNPEPGTACISGRLEDGWAFLTLGVARWDGANLRDPLDAAGLGIESIQFTLTTPPSSGVYVQLTSLVPDCDLGPIECQHWGFFLERDAFQTPLLENQPGTVTARIANFVRADYIDPAWQFDPSRLSTLQIGPGALRSVTGDYDYCVSDLKFLDAAGNEVVPE